MRYHFILQEVLEYEVGVSSLQFGDVLHQMHWHVLVVTHAHFDRQQDSEFLFGDECEILT
jgi:hypothetical protein